MRHRKAGYKLGRTTAHRKAMIRNLAASLFEHGQVTTTVTKAKAVQPFVEKIITKARKGDLHSRRQVIAMLGGDRRAFDWLYLPKRATEEEKQQVESLRERASAFFDVPESSQVERNRYGELRKAPRLVRHIFENVAPRLADRPGGYTRVIKLGYHRVGDGAELAVIQFVGAEDGPEFGRGTSGRRRQADRRTAYAAQVRKTRAAASSQPTDAGPDDRAEPDAGDASA